MALLVVSPSCMQNKNLIKPIYACVINWFFELFELIVLLYDLNLLLYDLNCTFVGRSGKELNKFLKKKLLNCNVMLCPRMPQNRFDAQLTLTCKSCVPSINLCFHKVDLSMHRTWLAIHSKHNFCASYFCAGDKICLRNIFTFNWAWMKK